MSSNWREFCGFIDIFVESVTKVLKSHAGVERNLMYLLREKGKVLNSSYLSPYFYGWEHFTKLLSITHDLYLGIFSWHLFWLVKGTLLFHHDDIFASGCYTCTRSFVSLFKNSAFEAYFVVIELVEVCNLRRIMNYCFWYEKKKNETGTWS